MSSLVFPPLPGLGIKVVRTPIWPFKVQASPSGREQRTTYATQPRYRYDLNMTLLRSASAFAEFQSFIGFYMRHAAGWDSFLFTDAEDNTVTGHGFGVGTGSATAFQLQRALLGTEWDALGSYLRSSLPRTNPLLYSQDFSQAAWTKSGTATVTANTVAAPDGTKTADTVNLPAQTDWVGQAPSVSGVIIGSTWTASVWFKGTAGQTVQLDFQALGGTTEAIPSIVVTLTGAWQRVSTTGTITLSGHTALLAAISRGGTDTATAVYAWGAQIDAGSTPTRYIATTSAAVTSTPAYWPGLGDGFEPVTELNGAPNVYVAGVLKALTTDYTIASGLVTFGAAPASGAVLSWDGNYYRRVRFEADNLPADRVVNQIWQSGKVALISVLP